MHSYEQVGSEQLWETILLLRRTAQAIWCLRFHLGSPAHHRGQIRITTSVLLTPACASGVPSDRFAWGCHPGLHPMAPRQRQPCMGKSSAGQCLSGAQLLETSSTSRRRARTASIRCPGRKPEPSSSQAGPRPDAGYGQGIAPPKDARSAGLGDGKGQAPGRLAACAATLAGWVFGFTSGVEGVSRERLAVLLRSLTGYRPRRESCGVISPAVHVVKQTYT